jgi:hypothetical protein
MRCITVIFLLGALLGPLSIVHGQQVSQPTSSDIGDIQPADPNKFYKKPGYSPYAGKHYPERPCSATSMCIQPGPSMQA